VSTMETNHESVVGHVKAFRAELWERYLQAIDRERGESYPGNRNNFDSSVLTTEQLEQLDSVSIYESWLDGKGRKHIRRF
jgi:hypothetical protein